MDLSVIVGDAKFNYRVGLLIKKGNYILVEKNPKLDFVVLPGGRVKTLESSLNTLIREVKEEMQIVIQEKEVKMKAFIENFFIMDNKKFHELFILYKMNIKENDKRFKDNMINHDSEANYYEWVKVTELNNIKLLPEVLKSVSDDNKFVHLVQNDL